MAFEPQLASEENVEHDLSLVISNKQHLRIVLTDQAAYWPGKKALAVSDPITTIRAAPDRIEEVYVGRKSRAGSIAAGMAMILAGLAWTFANYPESYWVGYPQALIVGGLGVSLFGGGRFVLRIRSGKDRLHWVAPIAFGGTVKRDIAEIFSTIGEWCKKHSVNVRIGGSGRGGS
jgi:hypothetical protein